MKTSQRRPIPTRDAANRQRRADVVAELRRHLEAARRMVRGELTSIERDLLGEAADDQPSLTRLTQARIDYAIVALHELEQELAR